MLSALSFDAVLAISTYVITSYYNITLRRAAKLSTLLCFGSARSVVGRQSRGNGLSRALNLSCEPRLFHPEHRRRPSRSRSPLCGGG